MKQEQLADALTRLANEVEDRVREQIRNEIHQELDDLEDRLRREIEDRDRNGASTAPGNAPGWDRVEDLERRLEELESKLPQDPPASLDEELRDRIDGRIRESLERHAADGGTGQQGPALDELREEMDRIEDEMRDRVRLRMDQVQERLVEDLEARVERATQPMMEALEDRIAEVVEKEVLERVDQAADVRTDLVRALRKAAADVDGEDADGAD